MSVSLPSLVLAIDHRVQLVEAAAARGVPLARCVEFKSAVVEAFLRARGRSPAVAARGGMLLDRELGGAAIQAARAAGVPCGEPLEQSGITPLRPYPEVDQRLRLHRPAFAKCLVFGRTDASWEAFEAQNEQLVRLFHTCERQGIPLVLELIIPSRTGEPQDELERVRPELTARWMRLLAARGVHPAEWKLEGFDSPAAFEEVAAECRGDQRIVILGKGVPEQTLASWFSAARRASPRCVGFAVGRTLFWGPLLAFLAGASFDSVVSEVCDRYLRAVQLWEEAAP